MKKFVSIIRNYYIIFLQSVSIMSISITSIFLMSVLVLGFASYPSALPNLGQDITNSQLPLGNVAFAQEEIEVELTEEVGISDVEAEVEAEEETEE